jgi:hypothetical protein
LTLSGRGLFISLRRCMSWRLSSLAQWWYQALPLPTRTKYALYSVPKQRRYPIEEITGYAANPSGYDLRSGKRR